MKEKRRELSGSSKKRGKKTRGFWEGSRLKQGGSQAKRKEEVFG